MNMLASGIRWMADKQAVHASVNVEYRHGNRSFKTVAWLGHTKVETTDESGFRITSHVTDILIRAKNLPVTPALGDEIITDGSRYEVLELPSDNCWCWSDPYKTVYRIHVRDLGKTP
jgi:hypothetical protein